MSLPNIPTQCTEKNTDTIVDSILPKGRWWILIRTRKSWQDIVIYSKFKLDETLGKKDLISLYKQKTSVKYRHPFLRQAGWNIGLDIDAWDLNANSSHWYSYIWLEKNWIIPRFLQLQCDQQSLIFLPLHLTWPRFLRHLFDRQSFDFLSLHMIWDVIESSSRFIFGALCGIVKFDWIRWPC